MVPTVRLSSDAGEDGWGAILCRGKGVRLVAQASFGPDILGMSSTQRELQGLLNGLGAFVEQLARQTVVVYGDN
jgi:hypothetical protein